MTISDPLVVMIFRPRSQLPSLLSWLLEQDAESIAADSANQSAEAHNALRRSAAIVNPTQDYYNTTTSLSSTMQLKGTRAEMSHKLKMFRLFVLGLIPLTALYSSHFAMRSQVYARPRGV